MSLKPLAIGLLGSIILSGALAVAAHAAGQMLEGRTEGFAALLVDPAPSGDSKPAASSGEHQRAAPSASASSEAPDRTAPDRADGTARKQPDASGNTSHVAPGGSAPVGSTNYPGRRPVNSTPTPSHARGSAAERLSPSQVAPPRVLRIGVDAPTCDDVYVYIVSIFENAGDSVATLALDADARGRQRRIGQRLGRYQIVGIGYNASRVSSAVWLADGSRVCQALVRDANPVREKQRIRQLARAKQKSAAARKARMKKAKKKAKRRGAKR